MADQIRLAQESDAEQMLLICAPIVSDKATSLESEPSSLKPVSELTGTDSLHEAVARGVTGSTA